MAIAALFTTDNMTRAHFEIVHARMVATVGAYPKGRQFSCCFGEEGRLSVLDIWESIEDLNAFAPVIQPVLEEAGVRLAGSPEITPVVSARILGPVGALAAAHAAFSSGDHDRAMTLVAPEIRFVDHGRNLCCTTRAEFRGWLDSFKTLSSDLRIVDAQYTPGGEWVTARFRVEGVHDGPLMDLPPSGRRFALDVCEVWRFDAHGEAIEGHNYSDGLGLLRQLGH